MDVFESHSPYEWAVQRAMETVDPWGDKRADERAAWNTMHLIQSNRTERFTDREMKNGMSLLQHYVLLRQWSEEG